MLTSGSSAEGRRGSSTGRGLEGGDGVGGGGDCRVEGPGWGECWLGAGKEVRGGDRHLVTLGFLGSSAEVEGFEAMGADGWMLISGRSGTV